MVGAKLLTAIKDALRVLNAECTQADILTLIDTAEDIRAIKNFVEELDKSLSNRFIQLLESRGNLQTGAVVQHNGQIFSAVLRMYDRTGLDTDRVKAFLGKRLEEYQTSTEIKEIRYKEVL